MILIDLLNWLKPAIPLLLEAMEKGEPVEAVFALDRAALKEAFKAARKKRAGG